ncbi:hypothetical protein ES705_33640 [subsurface metagenome]
MAKKVESWQVKHYFKMPDGRIIKCTYEKALKKLRSGKYGKGDFEEIDKDKGEKKSEP